MAQCYTFLLFFINIKTRFLKIISCFTKKFEKMTKVNLVEAQSQTILGLVNQILQTGELKCVVLEEVGKNEVVIGELSDYEKALFLASYKIADDHNMAVEKSEEEGEKMDRDQASFNKKAYRALNDLAWVSINNRLGKVAMEAFGLGIRKDWKLVSINTPEGCGLEIHCIHLIG
jgi:hypothetical protein